MAISCSDFSRINTGPGGAKSAVAQGLAGVFGGLLGGAKELATRLNVFGGESPTQLVVKGNNNKAPKEEENGTAVPQDTSERVLQALNIPSGGIKVKV